MKNTQYGMTTAWIFFTWASFVISVAASAYAIFNANIDFTYKMLFAISDLMLVQSAFILSKTIRDKTEFDNEK